MGIANEQQLKDKGPRTQGVQDSSDYHHVILFGPEDEHPTSNIERSTLNLLGLQSNHIKAIFFDVGDTLSRPTSGHWFVPVSLQTLFAKDFGGLKAPFIQDALQTALDFLAHNPRLDTEQQEFDLFFEFYRILLTQCNYAQMTDKLLLQMAHDIVYNDKKATYFEDVFSVMPELEKHFTLGIISNTWPSLDRKLRGANLRHYFAVLIMSCEFGTWKPDPGLYVRALQQTQLTAQEAIFIDNSIENLESAAKLGMKGILINRYHQEIPDCRFPVIENLTQLKPLVEEC